MKEKKRSWKVKSDDKDLSEGASGMMFVHKGWREVDLSDVVKITARLVDPQKKPYVNMVLIAPDHIQSGTGRISLKVTAQEQGAISGKYLVKKNDVIYSKIRPYLMKAGIPDQDVLCSADMYPIECNDNLIPAFLLHILLSKRFTDFAVSLSGRTGIPKINREELMQYRFILPPIKEQRQIAAILFTWDEAIEKMERLIEGKKSRYGVLSNKLLSGKFKDVPLKKFLSVVVREVARPDNPYWAMGIRSHGKGTFRRYVENPNAVAMNTLYKVQRDDIIVNITFAWEGAIAVVKEADEDCLVSHRFPTFEVDTNKALPEYLRHVIVQKHFIRKLALISPGGAGRNRVLNKKDFLNLKIALPEVKEQRKIGNALNTSLKEISLLESQLELYKKQKRGLMQKLLTGEWRVKTGKEV